MYPAVASAAPNMTSDEVGEQAFHDGQKWGLPAVACCGGYRAYAVERR
jgi:hypothetical protein